MESLDVTVVVCTFDRAEMLETALRSLKQLKVPDDVRYEILVVDNASTDRTPDVVHRAAEGSIAPLRGVIESRQGVCFARNRGIEEARGRWIAFFDDDQVADPDWLAQLLAMARRKDARCVGGAVRLQLPESCPPALRDAYGAVLGLSGQRDTEHRYHPRRAPGAGNLMLRRDVFAEVGRFDESLSEAGEDTELFQRIHRAGIEGWYNPLAVVRHVIPHYRVSLDYLKWRSLRQGWSLAKRDYSEGGASRSLMMAAGRAVQAYALFPILVPWNACRGRREGIVHARCRVWRTHGYARGLMHLLAPTACAQRQFHARLDFRSERETFASRGA